MSQQLIYDISIISFHIGYFREKLDKLVNDVLRPTLNDIWDQFLEAFRNFLKIVNVSVKVLLFNIGVYKEPAVAYWFLENF